MKKFTLLIQKKCQNLFVALQLFDVVLVRVLMLSQSSKRVWRMHMSMGVEFFVIFFLFQFTFDVFILCYSEILKIKNMKIKPKKGEKHGPH